MTDEKIVYVLDTSATAESPKRAHDIIFNGSIERVEFSHGKPKAMPFEMACKFMLPGFIVKDEDGLDMGAPPVTVDAVKFQIGDDEIVAKYEELTVEALTLRALGRVGGEIFADSKRDTSRVELIAFLKQKTDEVQEEAFVDSIEIEDAGDGFTTADVTDNQDGKASGGVQEFATDISGMNLGNEDITEA